MIMKDIVYILKNDVRPDELTYSLRSVEKNFYHRFVWFYGGCPNGLSPDFHVQIIQEGENKWRKVQYTLRQVCENDEITEDFWLFNDDFFVMRSAAEFQELGLPLCRGTIQRHIDHIRERHNGRDSLYGNQLKSTMTILRAKKLDQLDYALHCPILINRKKALQTLEEFKAWPMFRSLYGNQHRIGGVISDDFKIQDNETLPDADTLFLSTNDSAFREGKVGAYIRSAFRGKCKYEQ